MQCSRRLIVQTLVFSRSYLHGQLSPPEALVVKGGTTWARNGRWILPEIARLPRNIQGPFTCRKSTTWDKRLYFSWVPKARTLPLDHRSRSIKWKYNTDNKRRTFLQLKYTTHCINTELNSTRSQKVKLPPPTSRRHIGGIGAQIHLLLWNGYEWATSRPGCFTTDETAASTLWITGWMGPQRGSGRFGDEIYFFSSRNSNAESSSP